MVNVYGTDESVEGVTIAKKARPDRFFVQDFSTCDLPAELQHIAFDTIISTRVIERLYNRKNLLNCAKKYYPLRVSSLFIPHTTGV